MNTELFKCPKCKFSQSIEKWRKDAIYEVSGKIASVQNDELEKFKLAVRGDHLRCPECAEFLHLEELEEC